MTVIHVFLLHDYFVYLTSPITYNLTTINDVIGLDDPQLGFLDIGVLETPVQRRGGELRLRYDEWK